MRTLAIIITLLSSNQLAAVGAGTTYIYGGIYDSHSGGQILLSPPQLDVQIDGISATTIEQGTYLEPLGTSGVLLDSVTASATGYFSSSTTNLSIGAGGHHQEDFHLMRDPSHHHRTITISFDGELPGSTVVLTAQTRSWYAATSNAESIHIFELLPPNETVTLSCSQVSAAN